MKKKLKADPLAKVSTPNLRRMVKRLRAEVDRLEREVKQHHEYHVRALNELAAVKRGTIDPSLMRGDSWSPLLGFSGVPVLHLSQEQHGAIDRILADEPLPDPNDHPHPCGPLDIIATVKVQAQPDPLAGCVVVKDAASPLQLGAGYWDDWEGDRFDQRTYDPPPYEDTLPAMPAMTLPAREPEPAGWCDRARQWWRGDGTVYTDDEHTMSATWRRDHWVVTKPLNIADGRQNVRPESHTQLVVWGTDPAAACGPWMHSPKSDSYPLPPATWRAA